MAINMTTARKLCTKNELELVLDSKSPRIGELTPVGLRSRVRRARTLRDKYTTLASRQRRVARGKQEKRGARPSTSNENTIRKQEIFDAVLEKFQAKLDRVESGLPAASPTAARRTAKKKKAATKKTKSKTRRTEAGSTESAVFGAPARKTARATKKKKSVRRLLATPQFDVAAGGNAINAQKTSLTTQAKASKGKRVIRTQQQANRPAILGHVSARGRRAQARRDSR